MHALQLGRIQVVKCIRNVFLGAALQVHTSINSFVLLPKTHRECFLFVFGSYNSLYNSFEKCFRFFLCFDTASRLLLLLRERSAVRKNGHSIK